MSVRGGGGGAGSIMANLAARRRQLQQSRRAYGLGQGERGVEPTQRPGPPVKTPADPRGPQRAPGAVPDEDRAAALRETEEFLGKMQRGQEPGAPAPKPAPAGPRTAPGGETMLDQRLRSIRMDRLAPEMQFYALAGRPGSPREIAIFQARLELERQIGRPPTKYELQQYVARPDKISPAFPVAVEG